jgi:quinol---cytochrome-c reductase cytochrome c subunit
MRWLVGAPSRGAHAMRRLAGAPIGRGRATRRLLTALAIASGGLAAWSAAAGGQGSTQPGPVEARALAARGRVLYAQECASCHGEDLRGRTGLGPSLRGASAAAADFYLSTGRMPLADPTEEPERTEPAYPRRDIDALVAYIGSFGGPGIPRVDPSGGDLAKGFQQYTEHCAGCHQVVGRGGIVTGAAVPDLRDATPTQVAEAVRIGPYLMPPFSERQLDQATLDSIARYVQSTRDPPDRGGWGIGNLGPIPEGMIAWLLAGGVLLGVARLIGERSP